ncbi:MAG: poly-gamma-glutamate synthase PgsB [Mycobacterium sp.]
MRSSIVALALLTAGTIAVIAYMLVEYWRHRRNLAAIPDRVLVNGIRGKSSITRLIAGALRADVARTVVAKTTGSAARFIFPSGAEEAVVRKPGIINVIEQKAIIARAAALSADIAVIECMAVHPDLQELNQTKLIQSTVGVISNVRADHLDEMGGPDRSLDEVARSLCRGMPRHGVVVTAEVDRWSILAEQARARGSKLIYADPASVSDEEMGNFGWITFKENVACALKVAELYGVPREWALAGMYAAEPDPGVLRVDARQYNGRRFAAVNLFAANDPQSTIMNVELLQQRRIISKRISLLINCRPDRAERNGQMGDITDRLDPQTIFLVGSPTKSALDHVPLWLRDRVVDLGGEQASGADLLESLSQHLPDDPSHALVMVGNIHGRGEHLLAALAQTPSFDDELTILLNDDEARTRVLDWSALNAPTVVLPTISHWENTRA